MNVLDIVYYSGLNKFLYTKDELVKSLLETNKYCVIQLDLTIKEVSYIKNNFETYISILENILFTYNQNWKTYFSNITFNGVKRWNEVFNNCIFLYSSKNGEEWFRKTNNYIEIWSQKEKIVWKTIYDKIINLIFKKELSVRNLINLWIIQIRAREIYNYLKEKEVFFISENNHNHKVYNLENIKNISKEALDVIILGGV